MHPRIQELARQAQLEHCVSHTRLEEFATLIVKECAQLVQDQVDLRQPASTYTHKILEYWGLRS